MAFPLVPLLDALAALDEEGHLDLGAGLDGGGLGGVGGGVAGEARIGLGDLELHEEGGLHIKDLALVGVDGALHVLLDELEVVAQDGTVNRLLLIGLGVHEVVEAAAVDGGVLKFCGGVEGSFGDGAGDDVLHLGADKGRALAGLDMLELDDLHDLAVHLKGNAVSEIACSDHKMGPPEK